MALPIRQGATHKVVIGPAVAVANGYVPVTNLTLSGADEAEVILHDNGTVVDISGYTFAAITTADGYYHLTLQSGISNTVGHMTVVVNDDSLILPLRQDFVVIDTAIYDGLYADGATEIPANVTKWLGTAAATPTTAGVPEVDLTHIAGAAVSTTTAQLGVNVVQLSADATAADNAEAFFDGTGYAGTNNVIPLVTDITTKTGFRLSATGVDDVWDEATSGHVAAGSFGAVLPTIRANTAQAGAATTITLDASASAVDDFYTNQMIHIVSGTGATQGRIISDYDGTTKVATVATWATNPDVTSVFVITPFGSIPGASAPPASEVADAVWDEARGDHVASGSFGQTAAPIRVNTAQAGAASSITLDASASATTDFYKYNLVHLLSGTGAGQTRQVTAYNGTTKVATVGLAWATNPDNTSVFEIQPLGIDAATTAQIADAIWDEARSGHVAAGTFGEYVLADTVRVSGSTTSADNLESYTTGGSRIPVDVTAISGDTTSADNLEAYTDGTTPIPANVTQISGDATAADNLEAALDGTGSVTISANIDGYVEVRSSGGSAGHNASDLVASILTTAMTEAYAADGAAPTLAQALFAIQQRLFDADVSGTTLTVRKLDGTTSAIVITLDDGTNPTDINRTA